MSDSLCENFLSFFVDKTKMSRPQSLQTSHALSEITSRSVTWSVFDHMSLQTCKDIIAYLKPTSCHYDFIPSRFLKQMVDAIGPDLLSFINIQILIQYYVIFYNLTEKFHIMNLNSQKTVVE